MGTLGYGTDVSCTRDLDPTMAEVDPFSVEALAEAIARSLDCPQGGLIDDELYGHDLRQYLNRGTTDADLVSAAGEIRAAVLRDDRVDSATVTVTPEGTPFGSTLRVKIRVVPMDPTLGEFTLTLLATDAGVLLEEIAA